MRDTFADMSALTYRLRAATELLGVTDTTLRGYTENEELADSGFYRLSDVNPKAPAIRVFTPESLFRIVAWRRSQRLIKVPEGTRPVVITVDLIKGGVGKTTTACELAVHLQLLGLRCLLIDLDVQGNATQMMGIEPDLTLDEAERYGLSEKAIVTATLASVLVPYIERGRTKARAEGSGWPADPIKRPYGDDGPHLLPADTYLGDAEQAIATARGGRELYLRRLLDDSAAGLVPGFDVSGYDVVIFDCPPSVSFTTTAALAAADIVLAPIRLDAFSVKGLSKLRAELRTIHDEYQIQPELAILYTHYAPQISRIARMQDQLQSYRAKVLDCVISNSEELPRSLNGYTPLSLQRPTSQTAREYRKLAELMRDKIISRRQQP